MDRRLIDYLPDMMKQIREIKVTMDTEQPEFVQMWQKAKEALGDQFIQSATENGIARWEKILNIHSKTGEDLENRKFRIMTRLNEQLPYTMESLKGQLDFLCGDCRYDLTLNNQSYTVILGMDMALLSKYRDIKNLLGGMVPANMIVNMTLNAQVISFLAQYAFTFQQLHMTIQFLNGVVLDEGQNWEIRGISFPIFTLGNSFFTENWVKDFCAKLSPWHMQNQNSHGLDKFSFLGQTQNQALHQLDGLHICISAAYRFGLTGTITTDSMYQLDGLSILDGSRKLNAITIEEAI